MNSIDWNATVAWIAFGVAIITPCITTYLNNRYQLKLKKLELNEANRKELYLSKYKAYSEYIKYASKLIIDHSFVEAETDYSQAYHELYLHVPPELRFNLDKVDYRFSERLFNDETKVLLLTVVKQLSDELGIIEPKTKL